MAGTINAASAVDPVLQGLWVDLEQDPGSYKGLVGAPVIPINGTTGQFLKASSVHRLNLDKTDDPYDRTEAMGATAKARPISMDWTTDSVTLKRRAESGFVPAATRLQLLAAHNFDVTESVIKRLWHLQRGIHEYDVFTDVYSTAASFGSNASDPGNLGTTTTAYLQPCLTAKRTIKLGVGYDPTHCFMPLDVAIKIAQNDDVRQSISIDSRDQLATFEALAAWHRGHLGVELVIVDSSYEDENGTVGETMGDHIAFAYLTDSPDGTSFCNTFLNRELTTGLDTDVVSMSGVSSEEMKNPRGVEIVAEQWQRVKVVNPAAGYQLTNVLS